MKVEQRVIKDKLIAIYSMEEKDEMPFSEGDIRQLSEEEQREVEAMNEGKKMYHCKNRRKAERSETDLFYNKMPKLSNLPVYKKALDLEVQLCKSTENCPRVIKDKYIKELHCDCIRIIQSVACASLDTVQRIEALKESKQKLYNFFICIRILIDLGFIRSSAGILIKIEEELNIQITSWLNSLKKESDE